MYEIVRKNMIVQEELPDGSNHLFTENVTK